MNQNYVSQSSLVEPLKGIDIPESAFESSWHFICVVRKGLPGTVVRQAVNVLGHRELFADILDVQPIQLRRLYQRKHLSKIHSESILDTLRVFRAAFGTFENQDLANGWLSAALPILGGQRPVDLCNTFQGRNLVITTMRKIKFGDFS